MEEDNKLAFISLFKDAFRKCAGALLQMPLSETECKHFSNELYEKTGLVIGAKSLKNYSFYVLNPTEAKQEKPSIATLDTLARYVLEAPYTDEAKRKVKEAHYPYWFQYRNQFANRKKEANDPALVTGTATVRAGRNKKWIVIALIAGFAVVLLLVLNFLPKKTVEFFSEDFHSVADDSLKNNGWFLKSEDKTWWSRRNEMPSHLSLFTLPGDNWADSVHEPVIKNLLLRKIKSDCFSTEVHLDDFVPAQKWQQAGILLLEDTIFSAKSLRLSIAYNDFFGGYEKPGEIIVQAISSGGSDASHPEEIIHLNLFSLEPGQQALVADNLRKSALRIERNGNHYRFLIATGPAENFAFREILSKDIPVHPRYVGLFALQGFVDTARYMPARFKFFNLTGTDCIK